MTVTLRVSQRLSVSRQGSLSFSAAGLDNAFNTTWYILGFKRSSGAPTTMADFVTQMPFLFFTADHGTFKWGQAATGNASGVFDTLTHADNFPSALEGDHIWLCVVYGTADPPSSGDTFTATKSLGLLRA